MWLKWLEEDVVKCVVVSLCGFQRVLEDMNG